MVSYYGLIKEEREARKRQHQEEGSEVSEELEGDDDEHEEVPRSLGGSCGAGRHGPKEPRGANILPH
ncbi:hypothetical protein LIER_12119 [Lithospermum erythrorhizon]|uniref:Uncharacterized protein n=1 Tax=Lithospermum erythrorhizon TaxID=34254 RepID=A0AAV3PSG8_LITER